jgi:hypothetical protein
MTDGTLSAPGKSVGSHGMRGFVPSSPAVMLSPKATNFVRLIRAGLWTEIGNAQLLDR